jgi:hypothetical protein
MGMALWGEGGRDGSRAGRQVHGLPVMMSSDVSLSSPGTGRNSRARTTLPSCLHRTGRRLRHTTSLWHKPSAGRQSGPFSYDVTDRTWGKPVKVQLHFPGLRGQVHTAATTGSADVTSGTAAIVSRVPTNGAWVQFCPVSYLPLELIHNDREEQGLKHLNPTAQNAKWITQQMKVHSPVQLNTFKFWTKFPKAETRGDSLVQLRALCFWIQTIHVVLSFLPLRTPKQTD